MNLKPAKSFLKEVFSEWSSDKGSRLAAALAYYTIFSLAPLLIIAIAIAGLVFGRQAVRGEIFGETRHIVGDRGAQAIQILLAGASKESSGIVATILGILALLFGASGFFVHLQGTLNTIWNVRRKPGQGIKGMIKARLFSILMVLASGIFLLASIIATSLLWTVTKYFQGLLPLLSVFWQIFDFLVSFGLISVIFALIFKVIPDVKISWSDVWAGAAATALLFTVGQFLLGLYIGRQTLSSTFGAAGSVIVFLVWVYYSAQIFILGAEVTQVYARKYGGEIRPDDDAVYIREVAKTEKEMTREQEEQNRAA